MYMWIYIYIKLCTCENIYIYEFIKTYNYIIISLCTHISGNLQTDTLLLALLKIYFSESHLYVYNKATHVINM